MDTHEPQLVTPVDDDVLRCPWCGRHFNDVDAPVGHFVPRPPPSLDAAQWVHNSCKREHGLPREQLVPEPD